MLLNNLVIGNGKYINQEMYTVGTTILYCINSAFFFDYHDEHQIE